MPTRIAARLRSRATQVAIFVLLAGLASYLSVCAFIAVDLTRADREPLAKNPADLGLAYETVTFRSRVDGVPLAGWLLPAELPDPSRRPVVLVHDKGTDRSRGVFGHLLDIAAGFVRNDRAVLMFDLRGSGLSGGNRFTLGVYETRDVGGAVDFLTSRGLTENGVDVMGFSMGASTVLLSTPNEPLIRAVAADSGYGDLGPVIDRLSREEGGLWSLAAPGTVLMGKLMFGVDARAIRPIQDVPLLAQQRIPLLVIQGDRDSIVPFSQGQQIAASYGTGVQTYFVHGADHLRSYETNPLAYIARVSAFFDVAEPSG